MVAQLRRSPATRGSSVRARGHLPRSSGVLNFASLARSSFSARARAVGEGPVRALATRFERGFFRVASSWWRARGVPPLRKSGPEPGGRDGGRAAAATRRPLRAGRRSVPGGPRWSAHGGWSGDLPEGPGKGRSPCGARVDFADVFRVLHLVSARGFLVDGDVIGPRQPRPSHVTIDEALPRDRESGAGVDVADWVPSAACPRRSPPTTPPRRRSHRELRPEARRGPVSCSR